MKVHGHAFVGWHATAKDDVPEGAMMFLETTATHELPFEGAVKHANDRVREETAKGNFKSGLARMIEVKELRAKGLTPQPM